MMRSKTFSFFIYSALLMSSSLLLLAAPKAEYIELPPAQLEKLSSDDFEERETAYKAIHEWADQNLTAAPELLYKAWRANEDPEVQSRCYHLMKEMLKLREFSKGFLGIQMSGVMLPNKPEGQAGREAVSVLNILPNTPAQKVGLRGGDIILRVDKLDLSSANNGLNGRQFDLVAVAQAVEKFSDYIKSKKPDEKVTLHLLRRDKRLEKEVVLMNLDPSNDRDYDKTEAKFEAYLSEWLKQMKVGRKSK